MCNACSPLPESVEATHADAIVTTAKRISRQVAALKLSTDLDFVGCSLSYTQEKIDAAIGSLKWLKKAVGEIHTEKRNSQR